jgi:hypothetical protein
MFYFKIKEWFWNEQKYSHGSQLDPIPRTSVLAKASSRLLLCSTKLFPLHKLYNVSWNWKIIINHDFIKRRSWLIPRYFCLPTFADRGVSRGQGKGSPRSYYRFSRPEPLLYLPKLLTSTHETEWTPFQTHYFSENPVAPGIESGTSGSVSRNSDHQTTETV